MTCAGTIALSGAFVKAKIALMSTRHRPETAPNVDPETERIIRERLATADEDAKTAVDARESLVRIREKLQHLKPH
jgi:hypothetical protein